ncbi:Bcr/CflA family efflux MFS transporter [Curtobacterium sp. MCBD17_028]|uniref:Bcr/CflA family efflux MFS transporter n=1 Tax=Curtobacterium sp. MCBD17_028 TaxID=2175670 RepID=UPI000DA85008|nr:Bcr/CflA family efflux MFS transporter [Curtobacterium sp. MCBD17_028]PZE23243.1 Bcr/CflA family drug resistance efflux transporter [Curtobacterium sp. MCBD17_028]
MVSRPLPPIVPLAVIVGISPFATDMYIPALPALARDFGTSTSAVQVSLTAFLVAFAVGQILVGPLSDSVGRRSILLGGTALFAVASFACAVAPDNAVFVIARVVEGLGGAAGAVAGRAVVTDAASPADRPRIYAALAAINAVGPVVAPLAGGALLLVGDWRIMFVALGVLGLVLFAIVLVRIPETLAPQDRSSGIGLGANLRRMGTLLAIPRFDWYLVSSCVATIGFFAYISTSSFVFQSEFGFSETGYTVVFAVDASCMILTTLAFRRLVRRCSEDALLTTGLVVGALGAVGVLVSALAGLGPIAVWVCLAVVTGAWGFVITGSTTRTQALGAALPGTAAALQGGISFGLGGLGTPLAGWFGGTAVAMGAVMATGIVIAAVVQVAASARAGASGTRLG